ncbi:MAG: hypothetical protein IJM50_02280 [Lachnospiraceae bacterium]|nr:hypothetical protein [Lachnospiraceae bacterium]
MRRNRTAEVTEIFFAILIILSCIALFLFNDEYPVLFTAVFALASLNCLFKVAEALRFGENRREKSTKSLLYGAFALILGGIAYVSARVLL